VNLGKLVACAKFFEKQDSKIRNNLINEYVHEIGKTPPKIVKPLSSETFAQILLLISDTAVFSKRTAGDGYHMTALFG